MADLASYLERVSAFSGFIFGSSHKLLVQSLTIDIEIYKFYSIIELRIWLRITFDAASFNSYI